jgi:hypothetical protein
MDPTPALVGGDPVLVLEAVKETTGKLLWESLVLRLAPTVEPACGSRSRPPAA